MADKVHNMGLNKDGTINLVFHCPGCGYGHPIAIPKWTWNDSFEKPTFRPSLLCNGFDPMYRCHSFITDGMIQFLPDCGHKLANQTVEIPDFESTVKMC